jgi:hypothetical protein
MIDAERKEVETMKPDEDHKPLSSRRDFLKRTIVVTGYVIPTVMIFRMKSPDAWAQSYEDGNARQAGGDDPCNTLLEKIFKPQCW